MLRICVCLKHCFSWFLESVFLKTRENAFFYADSVKSDCFLRKRNVYACKRLVRKKVNVSVRSKNCMKLISAMRKIGKWCVLVFTNALFW